MKEINKKLGLNIRMLRDANGFTLDELATEIGVSRQMVWNWENHVNEPGGKNLSKVASLFKVSSNFLLSNSKEIDRETFAVIKINQERDILTEADVEYLKSQMDLLREERDSLKDKLLLQHEKFQALNDDYNKLKAQYDELKNRTGTK